MNWKHIFISLEIKGTKQGRPALAGRSTFSGPKGALTHHPLRGRWYGLRPPCALRGGLRFLRKAPRRCRLASTAQQAKSLPFLRLLPVKTCHWQLFTDYGGRETEDGRRGTEGTIIGNLPFGSKSYQSGYRPFCCRSSGLHELFSYVQ